MNLKSNLRLLLFLRVNLESDHFAAHLEPFLNERTSHFMHELISFAKSPFDIIAYDGKVRYDWPANYQVAAGLGQDNPDHVGETSSDAGTAGIVPYNCERSTPSPFHIGCE